MTASRLIVPWTHLDDLCPSFLLFSLKVTSRGMSLNAPQNCPFLQLGLQIQVGTNRTTPTHPHPPGPTQARNAGIHLSRPSWVPATAVGTDPGDCWPLPPASLRVGFSG